MAQLLKWPGKFCSNNLCQYITNENCGTYSLARLFLMDLTRTLASPHATHAASVHLPISLALIGLPLVLVAVIAPRRWPGLRMCAAIFYLLTSLLAVTAAFTGQRAATELVALANETVEAVVAHHRQLGLSATILPLITSVFLLASHFRVRSGGRILAGLAALSAFAFSVVMLYAGSSGGRLVYGFGIGTPIAGVDGVSGATRIAGAYRPTSAANAPPSAKTRTMDESADARYTPHIKPIDAAQAASVNFKNDVLPLFERHCFKCHQGKEAKAGLDLTTYAGILKGGDYAGACIVPGEPDQSPMVMHIRGIYEPKMPKDAPELTEGELHTIRMWIAAGAKDV